MLIRRDVSAVTEAQLGPSDRCGGLGRVRPLRRVGGDQPIADAELGQQDMRLGRVGFDLAPQFAHEDAQIMGIVDVLVAPNLAQ